MGRGVVVGAHVRHIAEMPAVCRQIEGQQSFFGTEMQERIEPGDLEVSLFPDNRRTREEAENQGSGQAGGMPEWAGRHQFVDGIVPAVGADERATRYEAQAWTGVEYSFGFDERVTGPPRVVVAERDIRGPGDRDAEIARRRSEIVGQPDNPHIRKRLRPAYGVIIGSVVQHHDRRARL